MKRIKIVFTALVLISFVALVNAQLTKTITRTHTPTTDTVCESDVCTTTFYSGIRNVYEGGQWKRIEKAKSLKGSGIDCVVDYDGVHEAHCIDFNYTSRKIVFYTEDNRKFNRNIPVKVFRDKVLQREQQIRVDSRSEGKVLTIPVEYRDVVHFGAESTTIELKDAGENLEDTYVNEDSPTANHWNDNLFNIQNYTGRTANFMLKYDISQIPEGAVFNNASFFFYIGTNAYDVTTEGFNLTLHHLYNQSWQETDYTWNTRPSTSDYNNTFDDFIKIFGGTGEPTGYQYLDASNSVETEFNAGNKNVSFYLIARDSFGSPTQTDKLQIRSKEHASGNPALNVTYTLASCPYAGSGNWNIGTYCNFTGQDFVIDGNLSINAGGILNLTNCTLTFNGTNQWIIIENAANGDKLFLNEYSQIN